MAHPGVTASRRRILALAVVLAAVGLFGYLAYQRYDERYVVEQEEDGAAVTKLVTARLSGMSNLKVAELSGTVQSTASDVRGFGWLRSDQVVKMPFSVDYFVDVSRIGAGDVEWVEESRTLIVNAPDVVVARPNTDEGQRSLVRTRGMFVTREAGEELSRRTSLNAQRKAGAEASSPERMAQARTDPVPARRRPRLPIASSPCLLSAPGRSRSRTVSAINDRWSGRRRGCSADPQSKSPARRVPDRAP